MRLTDQQQQDIIHLVQEQWQDASLWVFGSRVDDSKRGGDVDLLVETSTPVPLIEKYLLQVQLEKILEIPVDLLMSVMNQTSSNFIDYVKKVGVKL